MKKLIKNYTFNPSSKTIIINEMQNIKLEQILLITNVVDNIIIYNFADDLLSGSIANNVLTLIYDTTSMSSSDSLQIFLDIFDEDINEGEIYKLETDFTYDINMSQVFGSQPLINNGKIKVGAIYDDFYNKGKISSSNEQIGIDCIGCPNVTVQLGGTWAGTMTFEGTVNGGDFFAINGVATNGSAIITTTTTSGIYRFNTAGIIRFRVRFSTYTSGSAFVILASSGEQGLTSMANTITGSQSQPISQKTTSYETNTYDTNLATILGTTQMYRNGFTGTDFIQAPTVNPTQPTKYASNIYSKYPQIFPRLRVEIGGDKKLPFAQEQDTNKMLISYPELYSVMEQVLMQLQILNQNFSVVNGIPSIGGTSEIR